MAEVGNLSVRLGLDDSSFNKGLGDAERKTKGFGSKLASGLGTAGRVFGKAIVGGTTIAIAGLAAFSKKAIGIASDLEEVQNVVDTVFGESAKVIEDFSQTAGTQFGLSELAAKQYAGTMGALLTPSGLGEDAITDMSTNLVGLSGDMASFFNIADEEAFNKLRAGISGETEPLKQLGINMSVANLEAFALAQGIDTTFNSMTQAEQATLRYQFIMDATSKVQGDFAKTSDSLANQQRIGALNAENLGKVFGSVLLPQASLAMKGINTLISGMMPAFEGLAGGLGDILSGTEGGAEKFQDSANEIIQGIVGAVKTGLPKIVKVISSLIPVVVNTLAQLIPIVVETIAAEIPNLITVLIGLLPAVIEAFSTLIPKLLEFGVEAMIALGQGLTEAVVLLIPTVTQILLSIVNILVESLPLLVAVAADLLTALVEGIITALPILIEALPVLIDTIISTILTLLPMLIELAIKLILALVNGIITAIPILVEALPKIIKAIVNGLIELLPMLVDAAVEIVLALMHAIIDNAPLLLGAIVEISGVLIKGVIDLIPKLFEAGKNLIAGLAEGLKDFDIGKVISDIGSSVVDAFKSVFGIDSPSKRMKKEIGKFLMPGVEEAVKEDSGSMMKTIGRTVDSLFGGLNVPQIPSMSTAGAGALGGSTSFEFNVNVTLANGSRQEAEEAGRIIADKASDRFVRAIRAKGLNQ